MTRQKRRTPFNDENRPVVNRRTTNGNGWHTSRAQDARSFDHRPHLDDSMPAPPARPRIPLLSVEGNNGAAPFNLAAATRPRSLASSAASFRSVSTVAGVRSIRSMRSIHVYEEDSVGDTDYRDEVKETHINDPQTPAPARGSHPSLGAASARGSHRSLSAASTGSSHRSLGAASTRSITPLTSAPAVAAPATPLANATLATPRADPMPTIPTAPAAKTPLAKLRTGLDRMRNSPIGKVFTPKRRGLGDDRA